MQLKLKLLALLLFALHFGEVEAQASKTVSWTFDSKKTGDKEYDLIFWAHIKPETHMYSQYIGDGGPIRTSFSFNKKGSYTLVDSVAEKSKPIKVHDKMFDMDLIYYEDSAEFVQHVKVQDPAIPIAGSVQFMACDKTKCYPPSTIDFTFLLPK